MILPQPLSPDSALLYPLLIGMTSQWSDGESKMPGWLLEATRHPTFLIP